MSRPGSNVAYALRAMSLCRAIKLAQASPRRCPSGALFLVAGRAVSVDPMLMRVDRRRFARSCFLLFLFGNSALPRHPQWNRRAAPVEDELPVDPRRRRARSCDTRRRHRRGSRLDRGGTLLQVDLGEVECLVEGQDIAFTTLDTPDPGPGRALAILARTLGAQDY